MSSRNKSVGISGIASYLPPYRVKLQDWCEWTGSPWEKIHSVVGNSFRMLGPQQSVYTMAANAVLRLIERYDIDPCEVRFLALGTESSTDNSAGAIIVKGMVDEALKLKNSAPLARDCEVPEYKHACLGGIYALKNALRYVATDGGNSKAIVVCSDVALYERGSSGEPTQGAGAVAMLVENNPGLATINLQDSGTASDYRGIDFRKPIQFRNGGGKLKACRDIPVFNGKYSTSCYIDEMLRSLENMYDKRGQSPDAYIRQLDAVFMHRPFRRMPETGWGMAYLFALANNQTPENTQELTEYCNAAGLSLSEVQEEILSRPDVTEFGVQDRIGEEALPQCMTLLKHFRRSENFSKFVTEKMSLGSDTMMDLGNLYSGALPTWLAAGFEDALAKNIDLADKEILLLGYGSGDAAEAIPVTITKNWQTAASKIRLADALDNTIDISFDQYVALREGDNVGALGYEPSAEFVIDRVGSQHEPSFQDEGIEYYRFINQPGAS
ncbi:MAG: hydroxymethylglutaryl-CoA synthase family protein [Gammaproteobacteria bacterium]